jgi:hypothetical protein
MWHCANENNIMVSDYAHWRVENDVIYRYKPADGTDGGEAASSGAPSPPSALFKTANKEGQARQPWQCRRSSLLLRPARRCARACRRAAAADPSLVGEADSAVAPLLAMASSPSLCETKSGQVDHREKGVWKSGYS